MKTVNKNTYTFPDRKYKNRFKNYSINGKSLLILLCCIFSSQVCLGLTIHDQTKYYTITVGRSITLYYYGISGAESFSATPWGMGTECIKVTSGKNGQTGWCTIKAVEKRRDKRYLQLLQQNQNRRTRSRKYSRDTHIGNRRKLFFFSHLDTERCKHDL